MKSYELLKPVVMTESAELIRQVSNKLAYLGLIIIGYRIGRSPSITVQPTAATRLLKSAYTGQGWADGRMYKSYAAVMDGIKIVWHKPMRAPSSNIIRWPGHRRAVR